MDILNAATSIGLAPKKVASTKGGEYESACPHCGGKNRFRIWPCDRGGSGSYWCRQCGKWGDLVQFLVEFCRYSYKDAFHADGREMPETYLPSSESFISHCNRQQFMPRKYESPGEIWQEKAHEFVDKAHECLLGAENIQKYLESRGMDIMAIKNFKLGWFPGENGKNCKFRPRKTWGLPVIKKTNGRDKMLWIPRGLIIPCFKNDKIYRIRIRRPKADIKSKSDIKYYILPGSGMEAMSINPDKKAIVVIESELDGMLIARKAGSLVGIVALGSAQNKPGTDTCIYLEKAFKILISLDYDKAGMNAWSWWKEYFRNSKLWVVPVGKDPGEAFQGGVDIKDWIIAGLPPVFTLNYISNIEVPDGLYPFEELKFFLKKYPIQIIADKDRGEIVFDPGLKNRQIRYRVRQLFYEDDEIFYFLKLIHPDSLIDKDNCDFKFNKKGAQK
ncbi:MAG: alpha helicase [Desulfobacteraceae bacterium]|nr:alpha helicase [Desulfobacteraceae bacterium]